MLTTVLLGAVWLLFLNGPVTNTTIPPPAPAAAAAAAAAPAVAGLGVPQVDGGVIDHYLLLIVCVSPWLLTCRSHPEAQGVTPAIIAKAAALKALARGCSPSAATDVAIPQATLEAARPLLTVGRKAFSGVSKKLTCDIWSEQRWWGGAAQWGSTLAISANAAALEALAIGCGSLGTAGVAL